VRKIWELALASDETKQTAVIEFIDPESQEEGVVIIRASRTHVGLCLSLRNDGDYEAFLPADKAELVAQALIKAAQL
jgi:hypothetical protein